MVYLPVSVARIASFPLRGGRSAGGGCRRCVWCDSQRVRQRTQRALPRSDGVLGRRDLNDRILAWRGAHARGRLHRRTLLPMDHQRHESESHDRRDKNPTRGGAQTGLAADHPEAGVAIFAAVRGMERVLLTFRRRRAGAADIDAVTACASLHGNYLFDVTMTNSLAWPRRRLGGQRHALYMTTSWYTGSRTDRRGGHSHSRAAQSAKKPD